MTVSSGEPELLERAAELGAIDDAIRASLQGSGGALLVEGPAGIGKTRLLSAAVERARSAGSRVLVARAGELEDGYAWGLVRQLFEALLVGASPDERDALLAGAAALARPALGFEPGTGDDPSFSVLHGLYWLMVNLSRTAPALVAVDDVQWADRPSLRFVGHVVPRLEGLPVVIVLTLRAGLGADDPVLAEMGASAAVRRLRPAALSEPASGQVVRRELGRGTDEEFCRACHELTGGNPFLLHELVRSILPETITTGPQAVEHVRSMTPDVVSRNVLLRLARLSPAAVAVARAVAVLGPRADVRRTAALAGLDLDEATGAAGALIAGDVLRGDTERLEFVHPIVRAAVYGDLSGPQRGRWHAEAARLLAAEHARPVELATHLVPATPTGSDGVVETLRAAAAEAVAEGAPELAAVYLRRALSEPPSREARADVLSDLGQVDATRNPASAAGHLAEALELADDQPRRGAITLALSTALAFSGRFTDASRLLERGLAELGDRDDQLRATMEATLLSAARWDLSTTNIRRRLLERLRLRAARGEQLDARLKAHLAVEAAAEGADRVTAVRYAREALAEPELLISAGGQIPETISALVFADLADEAQRAVDAALEVAQTLGSQLGSALASSAAALGALWRGAVDEAIAHGRQSICLAREGWIPVITAGFVIDALAERDELAAARRELAELELDAELPQAWPFTVVRFFRGRLHAAAGDHPQAVDDLSACGELAEAWGVHNPAMIPWRSSAAASLAALGEHREARRLAHEEVALARRWGAGRSLGVALRAAGIAEPGERGIALLREAIDALEPAPAQLELARALSDLGAALRRAGHRAEARQALARGLDLAHHCGGIAVARRAREELVRAGAKPRRDALRGRDALTPGELRVAQMAARGLTNREIAQALFVTPRTVEHHLTRTYGKLAITSRHQLPATLDPTAAIVDSTTRPHPPRD